MGPCTPAHERDTRRPRQETNVPKHLAWEKREEDGEKAEKRKIELEKDGGREGRRDLPLSFPLIFFLQ